MHPDIKVWLWMKWKQQIESSQQCTQKKNKPDWESRLNYKSGCRHKSERIKAYIDLNIGLFQSRLPAIGHIQSKYPGEIFLNSEASPWEMAISLLYLRFQRWAQNLAAMCCWHSLELDLSNSEPPNKQELNPQGFLLEGRQRSYSSKNRHIMNQK